MRRSIGLIDDITSLISDVGNFFKSLKEKFVIGDQVPNYPIKSKNTLNGIIADIQRVYPPPTSVAMAKEQLARAQQQSEEAYAKGGAVNTTYGMIFDELVQTLKNYISYDGNIPGKDQSCPPGYYRDPQTGDCKPSPGPPAPGMNKGLLFGGLAIGLLVFANMGNPKGRRRSNRR